ncbi:adenylyl-sulfate kinase [Candidatus Woesearchaeota archaeon]|jgi:adenylylsulfate kinase|nr:adenylyl-sulfate kinase [Candidatus Woesearchaeota archaeon]|tara:strand:- start:1546 stop:2085 length:540 start_codon:yes stop_codon:yes gene_type:complete
MDNLKKAWTIWFTGLHGSGKSTIAAGLAKVLKENNIQFVLLDGDELRKTLSSDLGYSLEDRNTHMKRVVDLCKTKTKEGLLCIACVASPTESSREYAKKKLEKVVVVYVRCPIDVCEKRDVKGHYKKARNKEEGFESFLGVSLKFEEPKNPNIVIESSKESVEESTQKVLDFLRQKKII